MSTNIFEWPLEKVIFRDDLYPRITPNPQVIQQYAENIEVLPAIEVNQHGILIDGFHRWTAHRKVEAVTIKVFITETKSEDELLALAIERNASHGLQLSIADKKKMAIRLYGAGTGLTKERIAQVLSVSERSVSNYVSDIDKELRHQRKERIFEMYLACNTLEEIAKELNVTDQTVANQLEETLNLENFPKLDKLSATYQDDFEIPLYNVWSWSKKTNEVNHFGNSEQRIVDNLLYLYTEPFDIVLDPFAGGGSTIDVCKKRLRRYYVSDRKPIVEREKEIRKLDLVTDGLPQLNKRWSDVSLTYLDPPYWKQAEGKYSTDGTDLANMELQDFHDNLVKIVNSFADKQSKGVIALLIQPTQWKSPDKQFTDHISYLVNNVSKKLVLENRVSVPYSSEQYNAQQVIYAKENKKLLVISRELIIWKITS